MSKRSILYLILASLFIFGAIAPASAAHKYKLTNLFFLHHSVGAGIVKAGNVRSVIADYNAVHHTNFRFWDHDYNQIGLTAPNGKPAGTGYNIPGDNTNPDGLYKLWTTNNAARKKIMAKHQVIAFKSCFPASDISSAMLLQKYKIWYLAMRDFFDKHPEKLFVVMSTPPLTPSATNPAAAANARHFANWLKSTYIGGHNNIVCFDLFDQLAKADDGGADANMLRAEYRSPGSDSHPNIFANQTVGPVFAQFLIDSASNYR